MLTPTAVIAVEFADGTMARMQFYDADTSDERIQHEIDKAAWSKPVAGWERVTMDAFPPSNGTGWEKRGKAIHARPAPEPVKDKLTDLTDRIAALEGAPRRTP